MSSSSNLSSAPAVTTVRVLRGAGFIQPNTRVQQAAVLNEEDGEVYAEDLVVSSRVSTVKLPSTIVHWRQALQSAAASLAAASSAGATKQQFLSPVPDTITVVDFKPPETIAFRGLHKRDGDLNFEWRDLDAAVGGVHQPKVVGTESSTHGISATAAAGGASRTKKMWLAHELDEKDRAAYDALMIKWREESRAGRAKKDADSNNGATAGSSAKNQIGVRIRQRTDNEAGSSDVAAARGDNGDTNAAGAEDIDVDEILRRAQEALMGA